MVRIVEGQSKVDSGVALSICSLLVFLLLRLKRI